MPPTKSETLTIKLDSASRDALNRYVGYRLMQGERGVTASSVACQWITERLAALDSHNFEGDESK